MTLIAAFRCYEGAVLCADTQETEEGFRVPVHKIEPKDCGEYWLAIAGSGNGDLIDGFSYALKLDVERWPAGLTEAVVGANIRNVLLDFHANEITQYPCPIDEKLNSFLVCVKPKQETPDELFLWELRGSTIVPVGDYSLLGIGAAIYKHELRKFYDRNFSQGKALLLAVHLLSLGKDTSTYIGGDTDAIFVNSRGMKSVPAQDVRELETRVANINGLLAGIMLACADAGEHDFELEGLLDNFKDEIMELRLHYHVYADVGVRFNLVAPPGEEQEGEGD